MQRYEAVVLGGSSGGLEALTQILRALPAGFPLPLIVAQHLHPLQDATFCSRLNADTPLIVKEAEEKELEEGLLAHIRKFLIELGAGFAFVGQQVRLEVGGEDFFVDLLFYHLKLRCYVVVELKATAFKPEYAGKMNFYLSAIDDLMRHPDDQPSIGIILCKAKNQVVAEYALRDLAKPVGISSYVTKLVESLPAALRGALPSPKELAAELKSAETAAEEEGDDA